MDILSDQLPSSVNPSETNTSDKILAVFWKRGRLGGSYFNCETSELHILEDITDIRPEFNVLKSLISFVEPNEVVTSKSVSEVFLTTLKGLLHISDDTSELSRISSLQILPGGRSEISMEACKQTVLSLRLQSELPGTSREEHEVLISSLLDLKLESMIISVALLVRYLEKHMPQIMLAHNAWSVLSIHHIRLDSVVFVDEDTRRALQVFSPLQHPSAFLRGIGKPREGLSLLGLLGRCRSPDGMRRLREILSTPTRDMTVLSSRLDAITFFCLPHSQQVVSSLNNSVARVRSVAGMLTRICQTHGSVSNWQNLYSSIYNAILIGRICGAHSTASKLFSDIAENVSTEVHEVAHFIDKVVDFEESSRKNKFSVRAGIDQSLDTKRQLYSQVPDVLVKVAELELKDLPETIEQCSIVCITELGYLLCIPAWLEADADTSLYHLPDFQVKFVVNKHVYYKTPRCSELDRILGDLVAQMSRIESDIMVLLMQFIRRRASAVLKAVCLISDLDCVLAMADVARQNNFVRPVLVNEPCLEITGGRHPLQELCVTHFVPNDTHINAENHTVKLITGPNASGKSVYLKQVALIAYLAHVGCFVPADKATIGLLDHIRTRIQTVESCSAQMSAFFIDLKQMLQCIYSSTPNSLIVIDEFGKGTTEIDGQALLISCLDHFMSRGSDCPLILASTHFHRVPKIMQQLSMNLNSLSLQAKTLQQALEAAKILSRFFQQKEYLVALEDAWRHQDKRMTYITEGDELVCLHKVENGEAGSSFAHLAAKTAGLNQDAILRSYNLLTEPKKHLPNPKLKITKYMLEEIKTMKMFFDLDTKPASPSLNKN